MLKIKSQLLVAAAVVAGSFGVSSSAFAGEGGVAGSAGFQLTGVGLGASVTQASAAVAVGKSTAYAGATTDTTVLTQAFAGGSGGDMTINTLYIQTLSPDAALGTEQLNELDNNDININIITTPGVAVNN